MGEEDRTGKEGWKAGEKLVKQTWLSKGKGCKALHAICGHFNLTWNRRAGEGESKVKEWH